MGDEWPPTAAPRAAPFDAEGEVWIVSVALVKLPLADLTSAELAVAELVIAGRSNREIAATRATSPRTVANQLRAIYQKLGVSSRTELLASLSGGS